MLRRIAAGGDKAQRNCIKILGNLAVGVGVCRHCHLADLFPRFVPIKAQQDQLRTNELLLFLMPSIRLLSPVSITALRTPLCLNAEVGRFRTNATLTAIDRLIHATCICTNG